MNEITPSVQAQLQKYTDSLSKQEPQPKDKITEGALYQRINRRLKHDHEQLRTSRGWQMESNVGHYYILDVWRNAIIAQYVDLEKLGRELDLIGPLEELETTRG